MGKNCSAFEHEFSDYMGVKHSIYVNSGSSANLLGFFALRYPLENLETNKQLIKPGSEIIVPALTWSTTIWPIIQAGAVPVFVDSDPKTLQMKTDEVEKAITDRTIGICAVHILGNSVEITKIKALAESKNLWLIEDTCESLGVKNSGQYAGTFGDMGTYSFFFSHHMTSIEGGMIVTNNDQLADTFRSLRAHGWSRNLQSKDYFKKKYDHLDDTLSDG